MTKLCIWKILKETLVRKCLYQLCEKVIHSGEFKIFTMLLAQCKGDIVCLFPKLMHECQIYYTHKCPGTKDIFQRWPSEFLPVSFFPYHKFLSRVFTYSVQQYKKKTYWSSHRQSAIAFTVNKMGSFKSLQCDLGTQNCLNLENKRDIFIIAADIPRVLNTEVSK